MKKFFMAAAVFVIAVNVNAHYNHKNVSSSVIEFFRLEYDDS